MGRRLGQHFLHDPAILGRIAEAMLLTPGDVVLEIGPGKGPLTRELAARAARVVAIEADRDLARALAAQPPAANVEIIAGDALRVAWPRADVIAGNIPYRITSPLIERALTPPRPKRIVFLVQQEVADRLAAPPGSKAYGAMSAGVQLVADVEKLFTVRSGSFKPPPKVESALVRITPREPGTGDWGPETEKAARALIKALFQRRRQQIQRSLREYLVQSSELRVERDLSTLNSQLSTVGIDPKARPEELSPAQFVTLARLFKAS